MCEERFKMMEQVLGTNDIETYITELATELGIKMKLSDYGITEEDIEKLSETAVNDVCHQCNPVSVNKDQFKEIYKRAL